MVVVTQPLSDVTWRVRSGQGFSGKTASVLPACTICTSMSSWPRSMLKAIVNVVASFVLPCSWACFAATEAAGGLVDVHDAVRAECVRVHEPAQLDEQPVRVGLLQSRAVELLQTLGGILVAHAHAVEKPSDPPLAGTHVESLCVEPFVTALRHSTSVTRRMCSLSRVLSAGESKVFLPSGAARCALRFQR